jgi:hypothetical protein
LLRNTISPVRAPICTRIRSINNNARTAYPTDQTSALVVSSPHYSSLLLVDTSPLSIICITLNSHVTTTTKHRDTTPSAGIIPSHSRPFEV